MTSLDDSSQEKMHEGPFDAGTASRNAESQCRGGQSGSGCLTEQDRRDAGHLNLLAEQLWGRFRAAAGGGATQHIARVRAGLLDPVVLSVCIAAAAALIAGLLVYTVYVKPLDGALAREQAENLAREMDATIRARGASVSLAINSLDRSRGVATAELERLAAGFTSIFPDFLSLAISNNHGEILAIIGDVPLSEASRPMGSQKTEGPGSPPPEMFGIDPTQQSFFVTADAEAPEGGKWFARARFSRAFLDQVLASSTAGRTAKLIQVPDKPQGAASALAGTLSAVRELWGGPVAAEAGLSVAGWRVRLERQAGMSLFACLGMIIIGSVGLMATGFYLMPRIAGRLDRQRMATDESGLKRVVKIASAGGVSSLDNESRSELEPAFTREIEVPGYAISEQTGAIVFDFDDLEDAESSLDAAAGREIGCSAVDGTRPANIPESLEITWDERENADCPASPESCSKPGKFAIP